MFNCERFYYWLHGNCIEQLDKRYGVNMVIFYGIVFLCMLQMSAPHIKLDIVEEHWKYRMLGQPRIVNGEVAKIKDHPFVVMVVYQNSHLCGGSLYSSVMVLSAAHCFHFVIEKKFVKLPENYLAVVMGTTYRLPKYFSPGYERRGVLSVFIHEQYQPRQTDYDIAVLRLTHPVETTPTIQFVSVLKSGETIKEGTICTALGWGNDSPVKPLMSRAMTESMRKVDLRLISLRECFQRLEQFDPPLTTRNVCTYENGKDACSGDSGGPLVCKNKLVGIVSYGYGCAWRDLPGVFYAVNDTPWLRKAEEVLWEFSSSPDRTCVSIVTFVFNFLIILQALFR